MNFDYKSADKDLIKRILPHRYPFLLVDRVIEINSILSAYQIEESKDDISEEIDPSYMFQPL